jgi:ribosomal protein S18 acetylase RimI-like enzyme
VDVTVRLGDRDEIDAAVDIFAKCGFARHGRPVPEARLDEVRSTLEAASTWLFVAQTGADLVGFAAAMQSHELEGAGTAVPGLCYLDLIFVEPEHWSEGIGALLLDTVIADAAGRGFTRIHLLTHDDNVRAQGLYASLGFERTNWSRMSRDPANGPVSEWARPL